MADFIPQDNDELVTWLQNLKAKIDTHGPTLSMTAAQITTFKALIDDLIATILAVSQAKNAWLSSASKLATVKRTVKGTLRESINQWKASGLLTEAMATDMQVVSGPTDFDEENYQPEITAQVFAGYVRIKFKKKGVDGVNIYSRLKGQTMWTKLSFDSNSPYDDHTPLAAAGTPEVREYRAFGVIKDEQIGQPSDIVSVTFAG